MSVLFSASAAGQKLKPIILLPRKNPLPNFTPPDNVHLVYQTSQNFNETIICEQFIKKVLASHVLSRNETSAFLVLDQAPCHTTARVKSCLEANKISYVYVPKRMTNLLQPADVSWMRSIKLMFKQKWQTWLIEGEKSFTRNGNMRSPGYALAIQWISEIWTALDAELIKKSFDLCGITQSKVDECHLQLKAFIRNGMRSVVMDDDGADEIRGFDEARSGLENNANNDDDADDEDEGEDEEESDLCTFG